MSDALQRLVDKDQIRDLMSRYARGVDRGDWDLVRDTYHTDATDDHGITKVAWTDSSNLPELAPLARPR